MTVAMKTAAPPPFHLAFPVDDLEKARAFYAGFLGCPLGREAATWIDFDFWGHQIVAHLKGEASSGGPVNEIANKVDGKDVPAPHFGVVLAWDEWQALKDKLVDAGFDFVVEPYVRFEGEPGEQATLFIRDPSGNALEFKSFKNIDQLFARD